MKKLGFGCMRLPCAGESAEIDIEKFAEMADIFIGRGFSYFDTAYVYHGGKSEEALRRAVVERYPRESFTVADKMPMFDIQNEAELGKIFSEQLARLGVEYIDYYLLHAMNLSRYEKAERLGAFEFLEKKREEGRIVNFGFSFHDSPEVLDKILTAHPETQFVQLQINYLDWDSPSVRSRECYEVAKAHSKPIIVMGPVKGGALANVPKEVKEEFEKFEPSLSAAGWAVKFAAGLENVICVLSGMSDLAQVEDNTSYMYDFKPLDSKRLGLLDRASDIIRAERAIPCTACRYCTDGCPKKIPIPDYFGLYNEHFRLRGKSDAEYYYANFLARGAGRASDCIACGKCENICPQHIDIRKRLKGVSSLFDK